MRRFVALAAALIAVTGGVAASSSFAATVTYVATTGSDSNACTQTAPCLTFNKAYSVVADGGLVEVAAGTYASQTILRGPHSLSGPMTTFRNAPGATVIAKGLTLGPQCCAGIPNYVTFDGILDNGAFVINRETNTGIKPHHITYTNGHIWKTIGGLYLTSLSNADDVTFSYSEIGPLAPDGDAFWMGGSPDAQKRMLIDHVVVHHLYDSCRFMDAGIKAQYGCDGLGFGDINVVQTTLSAAISATQTTITVNGSVNFPTQTFPFGVLVDNEALLVTAIAADRVTWTIQRATTRCYGVPSPQVAASHVSGSVLKVCNLGYDHADAIQSLGSWGLTVQYSRFEAINPTSATTTGAAQALFLAGGSGTPNPGETKYRDLTIKGNVFACGCGTTVFSIVTTPDSGLSVGGFVKILYNSVQGNAYIRDSLGNGAIQPGTQITYAGNIILGFIHHTPSTACSFTTSDGSLATFVSKANKYGAVSCDPTDRPGPPGWVDANFYHPNFHSTAGAPQIGVGDSAFCGPGKEVDRDMDGSLRPASGCDMGAYQAGDTTPPVLQGMPLNMVAEATGPAGASVFWTNPTATDNVDPNPTVSCSPLAGSTFPLGTTTVTCTATDASGNSSSASFSVAVRDTTAPSSPGNLAAVNVTATSADLTWSPSTDAVGVTSYEVNGVAGASPFAVTGLTCGTSYTRSVVAKDAAGNASAPASVTFTTSSCGPIQPGNPRVLGTLNAATGPATITLGAVNPGETVLVAVGGNSKYPTSVVEGSNTYTPDAATGTSNTAVNAAIYRYAYPAGLAAGATLTITYNLVSSAQQAIAVAVSDLSSSPLGGSGTNVGTSAAPTVGATATYAPSIALVAFKVKQTSSAGATWPPSGYTTLADLSLVGKSDNLLVGYRQLGASGPQTAPFTLPASVAWAGALGIYKGR